MNSQMVMVAVVSAMVGVLFGLMVGPAVKMATSLFKRGLAMVQRKAKRKPGRPKKSRAAKAKAVQVPKPASRRRSKAVPVEPIVAVAVDGNVKPKRKVGRPSKAELARRASIEHEATKPGIVQGSPTVTNQVQPDFVATPAELTSEQLQELAVFPYAVSPSNAAKNQEIAILT